ncbi:hypothetical protein [Piscinibacter sp. XHJ-5]|uniref:hypothetical protein n=1 Tax=Piscinibacter sp. XHJ-5 TaxID=3037797 RepID=UPI002452DCCE|nr:hypothetical protein [Piscinibacter sp. XHJ-5]
MEFFWAVPVAAIAAGLLVGAVMRTRCRRRVERWAHRLVKSDAKLDASTKQLAQARKQIEKLQRELSEARRAAAVASSQLGSQRSPPASQAPKSASSNGFADTMPM